MIEGQNAKVELYFSCRRLKRRDAVTKVDPQVKVFCQKRDEKLLLGQTEVFKDTSNPNFSTSVLTDFIFESQQHLIFEVFDFSLYQSYHSFERIGKAETTLGKIMGAPKQLLILNIISDEGKNAGKLIVQGEKTGKSQSQVTWQWSGIKLMNTDGWFDKSDPFLRFMKIRGPGDYLQVHETEVIMDNLNPCWKPFSIMDYKLCGADHTKPFRIECWDWESDKNYQYIGDCEVTLNQLKAGKNLLELRHPKKKKPTGTLKVSKFGLQEEYNFIDYIRGGQQLKVFIAIDFTGSNKIVSDPTSLHTINPNGYNQYQQAIYTVSQILLNYDYDQAVHVYGFGGIPHWPALDTGNVSHCFPCTGNPQQPIVYGLDGVMNAYFHALQNVELSGPTYFSPLIQEVMQFCHFQKSQPNGVYSVLLILTDGDIHDMEETINCLINSSHLPLSIVIVGVGNEDFKNMEKLDGDQGLTNSQGKAAQRDLVQFVPFKQFQGDMHQLAQHVLAEIPDQLVRYMQLVGKKPNPPILTDLNQFENSDRSFQSQQSIGSPTPYFERAPSNVSPQGFHTAQSFNANNQSPYTFQEIQSRGSANQFPAMMPVPMMTNNQQNVPPNVTVNFQNSPYQENNPNYPDPSKKSSIIHRYNLEPVVNPLQEKVNLNAFASGNETQAPQQFSPYGPQQSPYHEMPNYNQSYSANYNSQYRMQIYPSFDDNKPPNQP